MLELETVHVLDGTKLLLPVPDDVTVFDPEGVFVGEGLDVNVGERVSVDDALPLGVGVSLPV